jgi:hypothetical protein
LPCSALQERFALIRNLPTSWSGTRPDLKTVDFTERLLSELPVKYHDGVEIGVAPEDGGIELVWSLKGILCSFDSSPDEYSFDFVPERGSNISREGPLNSETPAALLQFLENYWTDDQLPE